MSSRARSFVVVVVFAFIGGASLVACSSDKPQGVRDALGKGDVAAAKSLASAPECKEASDACIDAIAKSLGSKETYNPLNPDQAGAAAVAIVIVRERRGDFVSGVEKWLASIRGGKGAGGDAVRLAIAMRMAEIAPKLGKKIDDENEAASLAREIGTIFPGACPTYGKLATELSTWSAMPPAEHPDHAPCVQRDLARSGGPGAAYGYGAFRALEGAIALWNEERRALREGASSMSGTARAALDANLAKIDDASNKIDTKKVAAPGNEWSQGGGSSAHVETGAVPSASASAAPSANAAPSATTPRASVSPKPSAAPSIWAGPQPAPTM